MFISLCGINGSGKTAQASLLQKYFEERGRQCSIVKAYDDEAKAVLHPLVSTWENDIAVMFLLLAFQSQQYRTTKELLEKGLVVIADRWDESYLAHYANFGFLANQGELRSALNAATFQGLVPDVGFVLHLPVVVAKERRDIRGGEERFAGRTSEYYEIVQQFYCKIAQERGWHIIDGTPPPEAIHKQMVDLLQVHRKS